MPNTPKTEPASTTANGAGGDLFDAGTVTLAGLRAEFGIPRATAYELMGKGKLAYTQVGRRRFIPRRSVHQLMAEGLALAADAQAGK